MKTIEDRNRKLVENSSRYNLLSKLFILSAIMLLIAFISASFIHDRILNSDEIEMGAILGISIFLYYTNGQKKKPNTLNNTAL